MKTTLCSCLKITKLKGKTFTVHQFYRQDEFFYAKFHRNGNRLAMSFIIEAGINSIIFCFILQNQNLRFCTILKFTYTLECFGKEIQFSTTHFIYFTLIYCCYLRWDKMTITKQTMHNNILSLRLYNKKKQKKRVGLISALIFLCDQHFFLFS